VWQIPESTRSGFLQAAKERNKNGAQRRRKKKMRRFIWQLGIFVWEYSSAITFIYIGYRVEEFPDFVYTPLL
jgi:hypothetical protein